jgi:hypothetical protein
VEERTELTYLRNFSVGSECDEIIAEEVAFIDLGEQSKKVCCDTIHNVLSGHELETLPMKLISAETSGQA